MGSVSCLDAVLFVTDIPQVDFKIQSQYIIFNLTTSLTTVCLNANVPKVARHGFEERFAPQELGEVAEQNMELIDSSESFTYNNFQELEEQ
ncbi:hypothetical protein NPIL_491121 [Nephila pilipes]|uniref:Uncharacterized protein n=1 Tax=Nephila pilipes TaxID=299642 RepID=A0A8X6PU62_NEPPI|nr:hypothetical protein NPIL_491121 [Nephila pilipes]